MSATLSNVIAVIDKLLRPELFRDYAPNGLQVEGRENIARIVTGVTASEALIDEAINAGADALLVHHGYFWKNENPAIVGYKARRIKKLLEAGMSLIAYHLPLDAHPAIGNNKMLADLLGFTDLQVIKNGSVRPIDNINTQLLFTGRGKFDSLNELSDLLADRLCRQPQVIEGDVGRPIRQIAWCTGAAQDAFADAIKAGADVFITGEISERTYHEAKETGVHFIAAGHHATERYGIQALGGWLATELPLETIYIDIDNPI